MTFTPNNSQGYYLDPTLIIAEDEEDIEYQIKDLWTQVADTVNLRDIAIYNLTETETGQQWFVPGNPQRFYDGWRKVIQIPDLLAGAGSGAIAHNISGILKFTNYWGQGRSVNDFYQIPWLNAGAANVIQLDVSTTSVTVTNGLATTLTGIFVVLEYIKGA